MLPPVGGLVSLALAATMGAATGTQNPDSIKAAKFRSIQWAQGPLEATLGKEATVGVPEACRFTGTTGTKTFLEVTENPPSGNELGLMLCPGATDSSGLWFVVFSFDASGYVRDDERNSLDADAILRTVRQGNDEGNKERRSRGWSQVTIEGWQLPPHYDQATHNLTWSLRVRDVSTSSRSINHSVRLLGRDGVMRAELVADPVELATAVAGFDSILSRYAFVPGRTYAEWRSGDKVAGYGLTALVVGGAGVAAVKSGLLAKLFKPIIALFAAAWKAIAAAAAAAAAGFKSLFKRKKRSEA